MKIGVVVATTAYRHLILGRLDLRDWPSPTWVTRVNALQILLWTALAIRLLPATGYFVYDQAYFYELSVRAAEALRIPAYGPFISGTSPSALTPGGGMYLLSGIPFLIFRDPRAGVVWIIVLSAAGLWLLDRALVRLGAATSFRLAQVTLLTWGLWHARFTDSIWNADFFLFTSPALLYCAAVQVSEENAKLRWSVLFGLLAGISLQIHLSGSLAILLCGLVWLSKRPRSLLNVPRLLALAGSLAVTYLPYFLVERRDGWVNTEALRQALPHAVPSKEAMLRSLGAPFLYASHALSFARPTGSWPERIFLASLILSILASLVGILVRAPLKRVSLLLFPLLPLYFFATKREYFDHYVITTLLFATTFAAGGFAWLLSRDVAVRSMGAVLLGAHAVAGLVFMIEGPERIHPRDPWNPATVEQMLTDTHVVLDAGKPLRFRRGDELAFVRSVLAQRVLKQELLYDFGPFICHIEPRLTGIDPPIFTRVEPKLLATAGPNIMFVCRPR